MSRFTCPEEFSDQKIIWARLVECGDLLSGMGEYGLANDVWAVAGRVKKEVQVHHRRYVRENTWAGRSQDIPEAVDMRVCLTHARINVCRPGMREEREFGQASCRWSTSNADIAEYAKIPGEHG